VKNLVWYKKFLLKLYKIWLKYNPFDLNCEFVEISKHITNVYTKVVNIENAILEELTTHKEQNIYFHSLIETIGEVAPDMLWAKDLDGKYLYANGSIKNGLLLDHNPVGKDDIYLASEAKRMYGDDNHTFGEMCANSDLIVLNSKLEGTFWETGKVKGQDLHLFVKKKPLFIDGILIGTVGSARDITELVNLQNEVSKSCPGCNTFLSVLEKYKYEG